MSHLSILPTVLRDEALLSRSLQELGLTVETDSVLSGFGGERCAVALRVRLPEGLSIGWRRQADGALALVGDLQRLARSRSVQQLIGRVTRRYAAHQALQAASRELPAAVVHLAS